MNESVDVQGMEDQQAVQQLLAAFDKLPVGESLVVVVGRGAAFLLEGLQEARWGEYDWFPLGGERFHLHRCREQASPRQIREFMSYDHRRCDVLFAEMENAANAGDRERAAALYDSFELGMLHHFNMEEHGFFPEFEERTGMRQGPTMVMRMEHEQMRGIMRQMRKSLEEGDLAGMVRAAGTLLMVMQQHNVKEEQMLYAMGDMRLGPDADGLLRRMQGM